MQAHNKYPKTIEYRIRHWSGDNKTTKWKLLCDAPTGFNMTDEAEYKFKRQVEDAFNLGLSRVEIRMF